MCVCDGVIDKSVRFRDCLVRRSEDPKRARNVESLSFSLFQFNIPAHIPGAPIDGKATSSGRHPAGVKVVGSQHMRFRPSDPLHGEGMAT